MNPDQLPHTDAAASADPSARDEHPPGVDRPGWIDSFSHSFSVEGQGRPQLDLASIIRRPAGLPSSQVGQGVDTPRGGTTTLIDAFLRT